MQELWVEKPPSVIKLGENILGILNKLNETVRAEFM